VCGLAPFVVVRVLLQQGHSHPVGTRPRYGFIEYLYQSLSGLGEFFFTTASSRITGAASMLLGCGIVVLAAWAFVSAKGTDTYTRRLPVVVALVFYLFLLFVFNLTWIAAPLRYRHLYFLPLCLIPGICLPFSRKPLAVAVLLCPLILVAQGYRVVHWSVAGIVGPASFQHPANDVISVRYFLTGRKTELCPAGYVRVHPPTFEYMKRWSVEESASSQESVKAEPN
jgi:hypothetical protein